MCFKLFMWPMVSGIWPEIELLHIYMQHSNKTSHHVLLLCWIDLQNYVSTHTQTQTTYANMEVLLSASAIGLPIFDYNQSNCVDSPPIYHLRQWEIRTWEGIKSSIHGASMHRCQSNCRSTVGLRLTHRTPHRNLAL